MHAVSRPVIIPKPAANAAWTPLGGIRRGLGEQVDMRKFLLRCV